MSVYDMEEFYVHTAQVEMFVGTSGYGVDLYAAPVTIACYVDDARKLVRNSDGEQVVSESTLATYPVNAPVFEADSRVTIRGNASSVIKTAYADSGDLDLPDHVAVSLT
jgi:hypothetical protein